MVNKVNPAKLLTAVTCLTLTLLLTQNCGQTFESAAESEQSSESDAPTSIADPNEPPVSPVVDPPPVEPPPVVDPPVVPPTPGTKVIVVGAGYGGRRAASADGGRSFFYDNYVFPGTVNAVTLENGDRRRPVCPTSAPRTPIGANLVGCCVNANKYNCWGYSGHSTWLFRDIKYGNGMFVAVGGFHDGILQTSRDGSTWSTKLDFSVENKLLTSPVRPNSTWFAGVAYGNGRWVAVSGTGILVYSTDAVNWSHRNPDIAYTGNAFRSLTYGGGYFVGGGSRWGVSRNGETWDYLSETGGIIKIVYYKNQFWGLSGGKVHTLDIPSYRWVVRANVTGATHLFLAANNQLGASGSNKIFFSSNGTVWNSSTIGISPSNIVYIPGTGYIASSFNFSGSTSTIYHSANGTTWTTRADRDPGMNQAISLWAAGEVPK